ncbi:MAG: low molecular weight phosphatase family protein [Actinomycetota bacterium]
MTTNVLFVCTGNAARSVMGAALLRAAMPELLVTSAGTHSIPGLPMSVRTKGALDAVGVADLEHRSSQLDAEMADPADLVVIFEPMHITWIRRHLPEIAGRTASLPYLAAELAAGPLATLAGRIDALELGDHDFEAWEEVVDPAGGDLPVFEAAAFAIRDHINALVARLDDR